jgi:hypothetical protein
MPRTRPLLFSVKYCDKPFRGRHWYVSGFAAGKRVQLWFSSEKEAKAAAAFRNSEIKAHGTQVALSPVDRIEAIAAAERLVPYGKSIREAVSFYCAHLDRLSSSGSVRALCERVGEEFERRLAAKEISERHAESMRETLRKFEGRFGEKTLSLLTANAIKTWLSSLDLAVKTRNRHLGYVQNMLNLAKSWHLLPANPLAEVVPFNDPAKRGRQVSVLPRNNCKSSSPPFVRSSSPSSRSPPLPVCGERR